MLVRESCGVNHDVGAGKRGRQSFPRDDVGASADAVGQRRRSAARDGPGLEPARSTLVDDRATQEPGATRDRDARRGERGIRTLGAVQSQTTAWIASAYRSSTMSRA